MDEENSLLHVLQSVICCLDAQTFIAALKRFTSRRGKCSVIYSDNATKFNLFRFPTFGGLWETAVRSAKRHLRYVTGNMVFTYEENLTFFMEMEAYLNSRLV